MTDEKKEPLSVEEPTPKAEEKPEIDVDSLVTELARFGIEDPAELSGKLEAGTQAGRLAQLLGDERKRTAEYEAKLRELQSAPPQAPPRDFMDYNEGQTIDIEAAMEKSATKAVRAVLEQEKEQQRQLQEANLQRWNFIQSDPDYGLVKEVWEEKLKDPNFVYKVQSGVVDPVNEYNSTVRQYMKTLLKQSHDTITTMRGGPATPPHVETGERTSANVVSETPSDADAEKLAALKARTEKGEVLSYEEELGIIDTVFGSDQPL